VTAAPAYGVDFSGGATPKDDIWITELDVTGGTPRVVACASAGESFGADSRADILAALVEWVDGLDDEAVVGFDFPFSLPAELTYWDDWEELVRTFPDVFPTPDDLQRTATYAAQLLPDRENDRVQLRRETEGSHGALCAYNLQMRLQTFYGIRDVLRPLVAAGDASVEPALSSSEGATTLVEVYPAGTLKDRNLPDSGYKKNADTRENIVDGLEDEYDDIVFPGDVRETAVDSKGADALDSVVCALAAAGARASGYEADDGDESEGETTDSIEGHIYV